MRQAENMDGKERKVSYPVGSGQFSLRFLRPRILGLSVCPLLRAAMTVLDEDDLAGTAGSEYPEYLCLKPFLD